MKPDQRWDPAGSPSKISAMWSLGVSEVKLGTRGGPILGWGCRGQRPEAEWEGTWGRSELAGGWGLGQEQQFKGSKQRLWLVLLSFQYSDRQQSQWPRPAEASLQPRVPPFHRSPILSPVPFITANFQHRGTLFLILIELGVGNSPLRSNLFSRNIPYLF